MSFAMNQKPTLVFSRPTTQFILYDLLILPPGNITFWYDTDNFTADSVTGVIFLSLQLWSIWQPDKSEQSMGHFQIVVWSYHGSKKHKSYDNAQIYPGWWMNKK
jgi:hypothetical protein